MQKQQQKLIRLLFPNTIKATCGLAWQIIASRESITDVFVNIVNNIHIR